MIQINLAILFPGYKLENYLYDFTKNQIIPHPRIPNVTPVKHPVGTQFGHKAEVISSTGGKHVLNLSGIRHSATVSLQTIKKMAMISFPGLPEFKFNLISKVCYYMQDGNVVTIPMEDMIVPLNTPRKLLTSEADVISQLPYEKDKIENILGQIKAERIIINPTAFVSFVEGELRWWSENFLHDQEHKLMNDNKINFKAESLFQNANKDAMTTEKFNDMQADFFPSVDDDTKKTFVIASPNGPSVPKTIFNSEEEVVKECERLSVVYPGKSFTYFVSVATCKIPTTAMWSK